MAAYASVLAWRISWTEKPGGLQSLRWQRVGRDSVTKHSTAREARGCAGMPQLLELLTVAAGVVLQNTLLFFSTQHLGLLDLGRLFCTLMISLKGVY